MDEGGDPHVSLELRTAVTWGVRAWQGGREHTWPRRFLQMCWAVRRGTLGDMNDISQYEGGFPVPVPIPLGDGGHFCTIEMSLQALLSDFGVGEIQDWKGKPR